ncbi:MAG: HNH endonuclease domain-containing protein [Muricomes sp.]
MKNQNFEENKILKKTRFKEGNGYMINQSLWPLPQNEQLEIAYLSHLFDNMSECYKLFWFQSIVDLTSQGQERICYDDLINEMIANAWYMVSEYKLNLGPADTLEVLIHYIYQLSGLKSSEKKENILAFLKGCDDKELKKKKRTLTLNVPYRLQTPFIENIKGKAWNASEKNLAVKINQEKHLMYYFIQISGMQSVIEVTDSWRKYIIENQEILRGWIKYNTVAYLQRRNPSVPGIINKLYPPQERKLEKVKKYWKSIIEVTPLREIYADTLLDTKDISIDHFIPWSYVAHDELWNLNPTIKSANSSKSNLLPEWDVYFPKLCLLEYQAYQATWKFEKIHKEFDACRKSILIVKKF